MNLLVRPLVRVARRFDMQGVKVILFYIASIVTALMVLAVLEARRAVG